MSRNVASRILGVPSTVMLLLRTSTSRVVPLVCTKRHCTCSVEAWAVNAAITRSKSSTWIALINRAGFA